MQADSKGFSVSLVKLEKEGQTIIYALLLLCVILHNIFGCLFNIYYSWALIMLLEIPIIEVRTITRFH